MPSRPHLLWLQALSSPSTLLLLTLFQSYGHLAVPWATLQLLAHSPAPGLCTSSALCLQQTALRVPSHSLPTATPQIPTLCPGMPPVPLTHPNAYPAPPGLGGDHHLWTSLARLFTWPWPSQRILMSLGLLLWHWSKHILQLWKFEIVSNAYEKEKKEQGKGKLFQCYLPFTFNFAS